jgi:ankyrin repeat protein
VATLIGNVVVNVCVGASLAAKANNGEQAVHAAASGGRARLVRLLVERGAAVDAADNDGVTPLHAAAFHGHDKVCCCCCFCLHTINDDDD